MRKVEKEKEKKKKKREEEKMGRSPCCDKEGVKKGAWTPEEDKILVDYINKNGHGTWRSLPKLAGLLRCGKSCRLRWMNYLRADIKRGPFSPEEESSIMQWHSVLGNKWAAIASHLHGRTDNEVKNFWNSHLKKRIKASPSQHQLPSPLLESSNVKKGSPSDSHIVQWESARLEAEIQLPVDPSLLSSSSTVKTECDYFLSRWNSNVGESFREGVDCQSPSSQVSSSTKDESTSGLTMHIDAGRILSSAHTIVKQKLVEHMSCMDELAGSDTSKSCELDGSAETATQLLLDFPNGGEMDFLEESIVDVSMYLQDPV